MISGGLLVVLVLAAAALYAVAHTAIIVPQQNAYVVERLGKYSRTLGAGFHILVPFVVDLVPTVDLAGGHVVVADVPGLLDLEQAD